MTKPFLVMLLTAFILLVGVGFVLQRPPVSDRGNRPLVSWEECLKTPGAVVTASYPPTQCTMPDGRVATPLPVVTEGEFSCKQDSDCALVVDNSWNDCSLYQLCARDYSQDKWIAVNQTWYSSNFHCVVPKMMCDPAPVNDAYTAVCGNNTCVKTNLPD